MIPATPGRQPPMRPSSAGPTFPHAAPAHHWLGMEAAAAHCEWASSRMRRSAWVPHRLQRRKAMTMRTRLPRCSFAMLQATHKTAVCGHTMRHPVVIKAYSSMNIRVNMC